MTNDGKENIRHVTCTNHTTRSDRDLFRVCPSKLSKRELEDLYFSLLENNKQLKKTVNGQRDQVKLLTTKVNRMTAQKKALGNLNKDCCASTTAIINEQKESIADLKNANERLSDRIRLLNMRLCSAKQFLRRNPAQSTMRCAKCCLTPNTSVKNSSMSALNTKGSGPKLQNQTEASSYQFLNKTESSSIKAEEIEANQTEMKDEPCQQNKCRTVMDELKQKIENLEEELSKTHEQYSERMHKLEEQMRDLRIENTRARALQVESHHRLELGEKKAGELLHKLRDAEMQCDNLATELQIERSKVSELETQVKAADISSQVAEALEKHLKNNIMIKQRPSMVHNKSELPTLNICDSDWNYSPTVVVPNNSEISKFAELDKDKVKSSDDSGYAEKYDNDDKKDGAKTDHNILDQIEAQLNNLKLSMKNKNTGDDLKNVMVDCCQKSKSESNETYAAVGANSRLSDDIFHPTMVPIDRTDQSSSTSRAPDFLLLLEDKNRSPKTISTKPLNKFDPLSKFQMSSPLPVDVPRMPYFGENSENSKSLNNSKQSVKDFTNDFGFEKHLNENRDAIGDVEKENDDMNIEDYNINADLNTNDEILNDYEKKRRRSSLKTPNPNKNKDLSVSYDQNKIIVGSTVKINKETQENDNGKFIHASFQEESDSSTVKRKNHYKKENSDSTPHDESYLDIRVSEKECDLNTNINKKEEEKLATIRDEINYIYSDVQKPQNIDATKNAESPAGTSSGNSTYTVEGKPSQSKVTRDATYHIENESKDTNIQVQNENNHLDVCQGHARICMCPHIRHHDVSLFRICSGTLRYKTTTRTKNKLRQCHCMRNSKTDMHTDCSPGFVGKKSSINGQPVKSQKLQPIDTSTPNHQKTYNVEAEVTRSTSPDNTDHEISSLTDLPNEDKSPRDYISPGEEKPTSTFSDSYATATTTDYGSLSLGEVPITGVYQRSLTKWRRLCTL
ncbi:interaptin-like isoform X2 [Maniola jurtina]|uniref:interaptin-like isoform X2 n=1 Tax=Maniola jurtina TaxID=191418 RepID=UPI001E68F2FC|nr:interaptin-like isoform X2 [Maniola jurtina]